MENDLEKLENVFGKVSRADAQYEVYASAKHYPHMTTVFIPNTPYTKMIPFMEEHIDDLDVEDWDGRVISSSNKTSNEDNLERSIRRTKTLISDYVLCNEFDLFATFTFSPEKTTDRFNPNLVKLQMANWLKNQRKATRNGKFPYLIVPEFHADRRALHFHALFKNYTGVLTETDKTSKGRPVFYFKGYTLGYNSAVPIDNIEKVSSYVKKYITKDMPQFHGQHRFWVTKGLKKPRLEDNPSDWYLRETPQRVFPNEYGRIVTFLNSQVPASESHSLTEDSPELASLEQED
jgi:hypothetical protein